MSLEMPHTLRTHPGASEGQRNALFCCELVGRLLPSEGVTADLPALAMEWASRCTPPMPAGQVTKSVEGLIRKHGPTANGKAAPSAGVSLSVHSGEDLTVKPVDWLWKGRIPAGMLSTVFGDPGAGKTTAVIDIMARITAGPDLPRWHPCASPAT